MPDISLADAINHQLVRTIGYEIKQNHGKIPFARFMELALYTPGLGYYSAGKIKLGEAGDFITAPEITPLFAHCLAHPCHALLSRIPQGSILELGAGSGKMAADLLFALERLGTLPKQYLILEVSADLRQLQQQTIMQSCSQEIAQRVQWITQLPDPFSGIILGNEVIDAMPISRFRIDNQKIYEGFVAYQNSHFQISWDFPITPGFTQFLQPILTDYDLPDGYYSEINLWLPAWLKSLSDCLQRGLMLFIDYGFPRHEYYHWERSTGTLMCHYKQSAHADPFIHVGMQDITAHVDFTALAEAAIQANLDVVGYTDQASFLLENGLTDRVKNSDDLQRYQINQAIKRLTLPHEMGELFKVMALGKDIDLRLPGFQTNDKRSRL